MKSKVVLTALCLLPLTAYGGMEAGVGVIGSNVASDRCSGACNLIVVDKDANQRDSAILLGYFKKVGQVGLGGELILSDSRIALFTVRKDVGKWRLSGSAGFSTNHNGSLVDVTPINQGSHITVEDHTGTVIAIGADRKLPAGNVFAKLLRVSADSSVTVSYKGHKDTANVNTHTNLLLVGFSRNF